MNNKLFLEEKEILEFIKDIIQSIALRKLEVKDCMYHHNTSYHTASSIIRNGILSLQQMHDSQIKNISSNLLNIADDTTSHINGKDGISLSKVGLSDLYRDEFEYCPFNPRYVDFQVDDIKAYRNSGHYGNEFIAKESIMQDKFRTIDIRILEFIKAVKDNSDTKVLRDLIDKMNSLREMAVAIKELNLSVPLREASFNRNIELNTIELAKSKVLCLKDEKSV